NLPPIIISHGRWRLADLENVTLVRTVNDPLDRRQVPLRCNTNSRFHQAILTCCFETLPETLRALLRPYDADSQRNSRSMHSHLSVPYRWSLASRFPSRNAKPRLAGRRL